MTRDEILREMRILSENLQEILDNLNSLQKKAEAVFKAEDLELKEACELVADLGTYNERR